MEVLSKSLVMNLLEIIESDAKLSLKLNEVDHKHGLSSNKTNAENNLKTIQRIIGCLGENSYEAEISFNHGKIA